MHADAPLRLKVIEPPIALSPDRPPPAETVGVTLGELCRAARIQCRVTMDDPPRIAIHGGRGHMRSPGVYYVGAGRRVSRDRMTREMALRILEILAHGFHDYGARECVCGRGLFIG